MTAPGPGEVLLGKRRLGPLPLAGQSLRIGSHSLTVRSRKLGYAISHKVQITTGAHLRLRLQPRKGTIRILVHPWARVTLDGRLLGITPLDPIAVYQGPHVLVFRNSDLKQARTQRVLVQPGKVALVKVVFE